jgi:hypothetical protein
MEKNGEKIKKYALVTDSTSDIPAELAEEYDINIIPICIHCDGKEFRDGIDISSNQIYTLQKKRRQSLPPPLPLPVISYWFIRSCLKRTKKYFQFI